MERFNLKLYEAKRNFKIARKLFISHMAADIFIGSAVLANKFGLQLLTPENENKLTLYFFTELLVIMAAFLNRANRQEDVFRYRH